MDLKNSLNLIPRGTTIDVLKWAYIEHVLKLHGYNKTYASRELRIPPRTFSYWLASMRKRGIKVDP